MTPPAAKLTEGQYRLLLELKRKPQIIFDIRWGDRHKFIGMARRLPEICRVRKLDQYRRVLERTRDFEIIQVRKTKSRTRPYAVKIKVLSR